MITRDERKAAPLMDLLKQTGAIPYHVPLLRFEPILSSSLDNTMRQLDQTTDWLFFTSGNAVDFFQQYIESLSIHPSCKIAAVGEKTANKLMEIGLQVDFQPSVFQGSSMVSEFLDRYGSNQRIALICGNRAREEIPNLLTKKQVDFQRVVLYRTIKNMEGKETLHRLFADQNIDACFFTSPSIVDQFDHLMDAALLPVVKQKLICVAIGKTTANHLEANGYQRVVYPNRFTTVDMIKVLVEYVQYEERKGENR
ncbi:uroporphyrinogen-III synthase [Gracilibacillus sp. YIM 98692]|uniref:uroporphyrinogen-III synthase n=1 Tax=Gracilibacillus sp. YIM 98692 TaxID=2663532 RepID=UPI0013CFF3EA|nr:uroporphyrinogen-III synthase [Gracilibacillus sp. YIM 98692]